MASRALAVEFLIWSLNDLFKGALTGWWSITLRRKCHIHNRNKYITVVGPPERGASFTQLFPGSSLCRVGHDLGGGKVCHQPVPPSSFKIQALQFSLQTQGSRETAGNLLAGCQVQGCCLPHLERLTNELTMILSLRSEAPARGRGIVFQLRNKARWARRLSSAHF